MAVDELTVAGNSFSVPFVGKLELRTVFFCLKNNFSSKYFCCEQLSLNIMNHPVDVQNARPGILLNVTHLYINIIQSKSNIGNFCQSINLSVQQLIKQHKTLETYALLLGMDFCLLYVTHSEITTKNPLCIKLLKIQKVNFKFYQLLLPLLISRNRRSV